MRLPLFLLASLFSLAFTNPNYLNPASSDLNSGNCIVTSPDRVFLKSPVIVDDTPCGPYDNFKISMTDINGLIPQEDGARGSFVVNYNGAKLQVNGNSYTSTILTFRSQAEHILARGRGALEMQIEMDNDDPSKLPAVLAFSVHDLGQDRTDITKMEQFRVFDKFKVVESLNPTSWTLNLNLIEQKMMLKASNYQFLNLYTYPGTFTYSPCDQTTWYIYAMELFTTTDVINSFNGLVSTATQFTPGVSPNLNSRPFTGPGGGQDHQPVQKLCFSGYFRVEIGYNYGLWFGIVIIIFFFLITLSLGEKPIKNPNYKEDVWTHHPFYSVYAVGNDIHTRKSRASLILALITINALFSAIFYRESDNRLRGSNSIVFGVYSALISFFVTYFIGNILRHYYNAKYQYHKTNEINWDQKAQNRIFAYYVAIFWLIVVAWPITVWMMNDLHAETDQGASNMWVASFFIGIGLELLIFYPLICFLAKRVKFIRGLAKRRGFMYDSVCHETYMEYVKQQ